LATSLGRDPGTKSLLLMHRSVAAAALAKKRCALQSEDRKSCL